jgi:hypothetical protein
MGWDKGRYYTRSKKVNGRVRREYIGTGQTAAVIAHIDAHERKERQIRRAILKEEQALLDGLDADLRAFIDLTDLAVQAVLMAAGFHQHHRGEWRKQRGR